MVRLNRPRRAVLRNGSLRKTKCTNRRNVLQSNRSYCFRVHGVEFLGAQRPRPTVIHRHSTVSRRCPSRCFAGVLESPAGRTDPNLLTHSLANHSCGSPLWPRSPFPPGETGPTSCWLAGVERLQLTCFPPWPASRRKPGQGRRSRRDGRRSGDRLPPATLAGSRPELEPDPRREARVRTRPPAPGLALVR